MFKSPLVLPLTLIFAGVLAFMVTTGILPAQVMRLWPILFVILGLIGLVSLSNEEIFCDTSMEEKKPAPKAVKKVTKKTAHRVTKK
jgi:hypothetical protein